MSIIHETLTMHVVSCSRRLLIDTVKQQYTQYADTKTEIKKSKSFSLLFALMLIFL